MPAKIVGLALTIFCALSSAAFPQSTPRSQNAINGSGAALAETGQLRKVNLNTATADELRKLPRLNPGSASNVCFRSQLDSGAVDDAFAHAAHVEEEEFSFGRHTAVTLEPRAIVADYDPAAGMLTVHHGTQTPYQFQDLYSRHYGIPEARVRVIATDIGGSFGMKLHVYHEDMAVVGLSILLGRPVKYVADRIESFVSDIHARDHRVRARMALDAEGDRKSVV